MNDLSLYSNEELINELFSRTNFFGILYHRKGDYRGKYESNHPFSNTQFKSMELRVTQVGNKKMTHKLKHVTNEVSKKAEKL